MICALTLMNLRRYNLLFLAAVIALASSTARAQRPNSLAQRSLGEVGPVDLTGATIVTPSTLAVPERTAVRVLVEEIEKRTTVRLPVASEWPAGTVPVIGIGPLATASGWARAGLRDAPPDRPGAEGYSLVPLRLAESPFVELGRQRRGAHLAEFVEGLRADRGQGRIGGHCRLLWI